MTPFGSALQHAADRVRAWRFSHQVLAALGAGLLAATAFPPFDFFPGLLAGYAFLVLLVDGAVIARPKPLRRAALIGWAFGYGYFLLGLYWVGYAFLVDAAKFEWLLPFVAILFPGGMALFYMLATAVSAYFWRRSWDRVFVLAAAFWAAEWLRGHIFTGFPWNLPGYGWGASEAILQNASLIGVYGLSLLTLLLGASLALLCENSRVRLVPAAMAGLFAMLWIWGAVRLAQADNAVVPNVHLRIVQPVISQKVKYRPEYVQGEWQTLLNLSRAPSRQPITDIIWPEAAPPLILMREPVALAEIAGLTADGAALFTGAVRIADESGGRRRYYNSFYLFGAGGKVLATYDKFHLVPFGEYIPFESFFAKLGISQIGGGDTGFSEGPGPRTIDAPNAPPFSPLICYEIIFPGHVTADPRPSWLVAMTDNSWFGPDAGPEQHLLIARTRAIEEGLPVARAANDGISAIIDAYGRIRGELHLGLRAVLDGDLPVALRPTPFVRFKNGAAVILFLLCAGIPLVARMRQRT